MPVPGRGAMARDAPQRPAADAPERAAAERAAPRPRSRSNSYIETAGQWAKRARRWETSQGDLLSGYWPTLWGAAQCALAAALAAYGGYLLYCEGCLDTVADAAAMLLAALHDFAAGVRGSPALFLLCALSAGFAVARAASLPPAVLAVDFAVAESSGDPQLRVTYDRFMSESRLIGSFSEDSLAFQQRMLHSSGVGEDSMFPRSIFGDKPQQLSYAGARQEAEEVMIGCVRQLFAKNTISPGRVDVVVVNCSLFCPTPSLASMVVNRMKLRPDVLSYSLGGMGCSANVIAVDLASRVLATLPRGGVALVVSTENITQNWYRGNERSMLLSNCLFRCGAAAVLLETRSRLRLRLCRAPGALRLEEVVRTHMGQNDKCYESVYQKEDSDGTLGVSLSKQIMQIAGDALKSNITVLAPRVLPWREQLRFFLNLIARRALQGRVPCCPAAARRAAEVALRWEPARDACGVRPDPGAGGAPMPYVPDFTSCFAHILVHTGGRAVIDAVETNLRLPPEYLTPSREVLREFGNTSSASIWYEMDYLRKRGLLKRGERVWQIAFGSGFKCNSAVWRCL